jgi:hypothetical protein
MATAPLKNNDRERRFPQFGLRTLMIVVGLAAVLFSVMGWLGPVPSAGLLLALTVVGLHVVGNAVGTSLRDHAPSRSAVEPPNAQPASETNVAREHLPLPRLHQRTPLGWIVRAATLLGCGVGAWLGYDVLGQWLDGLFVGMASSAILGGFFGFLLGSFFKMALMAWWQAVHCADPARHS